MATPWTDAGRFTYIEGQLRLFPDVTTDPGLYRLTFKSGAIYIGEAHNLQRRLSDYLKYYPGVGIESEFRINKRLRDELGAAIEIMTGEEFATRSGRCQREHQEIEATKVRSLSEGFRLLNGGTIEERIEFFRSEIARLEKKLNDHRGQVDLDETMHADLFENSAATAMSDELARRTAIELGFTDPEFLKQIG